MVVRVNAIVADGGVPGSAVPTLPQNVYGVHSFLAGLTTAHFPAHYPVHFPGVVGVAGVAGVDQFVDEMCAGGLQVPDSAVQDLHLRAHGVWPFSVGLIAVLFAVVAGIDQVAAEID